MDKGTLLPIVEEVWGVLLRGGPVMIPIFLLGWIAWILIFRQAVLHSDFRKEILRPGGVPGGEREIRTDREGEDWIAEHRARAAPRLRAHLSSIARLAALAPMLGLLGTVTGMRATFATITTHGFGNPVLLADGISEALLTTQAGLVVAFPLLLAHTRLKTGASRIEHRLDAALFEERNRLLTSRQEGAA